VASPMYPLQDCHGKIDKKIALVAARALRGLKCICEALIIFPLFKKIYSKLVNFFIYVISFLIITI